LKWLQTNEFKRDLLTTPSCKRGLFLNTIPAPKENTCPALNRQVSLDSKHRQVSLDSKHHQVSLDSKHRHVLLDSQTRRTMFVSQKRPTSLVWKNHFSRIVVPEGIISPF
jgi:hypothetical protein